MRWEGRAESTQVEDRRGFGGRAIGIGGVGGIGAVLLVVFALFMGVDPRQLVNVNQPGANGPQIAPERRVDPEEENAAKFSKVILRDTEEVWDELFREQGRRYQKPMLVLFSGATDSGCGFAESAVGPFYCPDDDRVYLDLSFFRDMQRNLNSPGDFARAYVIAHEVGHHVQHQLGFTRPRGPPGTSRTEFNRHSVRLELQADFLAGVWAHHGQRKFDFLQEGDIEEALQAAFAIGDDRLQKQARGYVVPDSFTHGTSRQRMRWFMAGFERGDLSDARLLFELPYDQL